QAPAQLVHRTIIAATQFASGQALTGTAIVLAEGALRALAFKKLAGYFAIFVAIGGLSLAGGVAMAPPTPSPVTKNLTRAGVAQQELRAAAKDQARLDLHGSPLPARAIARIGTDLGVVVRESGFQNGYLVFTPDGKSLVFSGSNNFAIRFCDPATGKEQRRI